jgi:hypothetical protein
MQRESTENLATVALCYLGIHELKQLNSFFLRFSQLCMLPLHTLYKKQERTRSDVQDLVAAGASC